MNQKRREAEGKEDNLPGPSRQPQTTSQIFRRRNDSPGPHMGISSDAGPWKEMTKEELEAVVENLMNDPIEEDEGIRAYQIQKDDRGTVHVTRIAPDAKEWKAEEGPNEGRVSGGPNDEENEQTDEATRLTQKGSDPHPSDHNSIENRATNDGLHENWDTFPWESISTQTPEWWWKPPVDLPTPEPTEQVKSAETSQTIKQDETTHQGDTIVSSLLFSSLSKATRPSPSRSSPCLKHMSPQPVPTRLPYQTHFDLTVKSTEDVEAQKKRSSEQANGRHEDDDYEVVNVPPVPDPPRPGLIASAHLAQISIPGSTPHEASFFGYGTTLVLEDGDGRTQTHQGHALVHLFSIDTPNSESFPRPPPPGRIEAIRIRVFPFQGEPLTRVPLYDPVVFRKPEVDNIIPGINAIRFNPRTRTRDPRDRIPLAHIDRPYGRSAENRTEMSAAETLVGLRSRLPSPECLPSHDTPTYTARPSSEPEKDVQPQRTEIQFVPGGVLPGTFDVGDSGTEPPSDPGRGSRIFSQPGATTAKEPSPLSKLNNKPTHPHWRQGPMETSEYIVNTLKTLVQFTQPFTTR